ncbi:MAG TPA: contractile injection system protein, VgrG/Pvc8 family [Thermoanaerobaculia bacterium]|nr:contractile injection system protein, VgrG/Pvc8 family [Thermoanaerobaculia bacterium]
MADNGSNRVKATRPKIFVAGREETGLSQALLRMSVRETVEGLAAAELRIGNWGPKDNSIGFLYFDRKKLDFGKAVQVKLDDDLLFDGRVSAIEAEFGEGRPPEIAVLLEDRFQDLRMTRRTRTFTDVGDADVIRRVATVHGLQADVDVPGPVHKVVAQVNQSDLAFLRERARSAGAELWIDNGKIFAKPRTARNGAAVKLKYGADLRELTLVADLAHQRTSVDVSGWDVSGKQAIRQQADDAVLRNELGSDASGAKILREAFGERKESIAHRVPLSAEEARTEAEAWFRSAGRRFLVGRGLAQPNGKLRVGAWVELDGLSTLFNGKYYLAEVQHLFDGAGGFRSEFTAERPGLGRAE